MKEQDQYPIDDYLLNKLNAADKQKFEVAISQNQDIAKEVEMRSLIKNYVEIVEDCKIESIVGGIHEQELKYRKRFFGYSKSQVLSIAAIGGVLIASLISLWTINQNQNIDLYANYYETYSLRFGERSDEQVKINEAGRAYIKKEYDKAGPLFQSILKENPNESRAIFALGIIGMEKEQWLNAERYFQLLIDKKDRLFENQAKWYMSLLYLKNGKIVETKEILLELSSNNQVDFNKEAKALLKDLEKK